MTRDELMDARGLRTKDFYGTPRELAKWAVERYELSWDSCAEPWNAVTNGWYGLQPDGAFVDAMTRSWKGRHWLNPPYSQLSVWVEKARMALTVEDAQIVVFLGPGDFSTRWFRAAWFASEQVYLLNKRMAFLDADTQAPKPGPDFTSVLFVMTRDSAGGQQFKQSPTAVLLEESAWQTKDGKRQSAPSPKTLESPESRSLASATARTSRTRFSRTSSR